MSLHPPCMLHDATEPGPGSWPCPLGPRFWWERRVISVNTMNWPSAQEAGRGRRCGKVGLIQWEGWGGPGQGTQDPEQGLLTGTAEGAGGAGAPHSTPRQGVSSRGQNQPKALGRGPKGPLKARGRTPGAGPLGWCPGPPGPSGSVLGRQEQGGGLCSHA